MAGEHLRVLLVGFVARIIATIILGTLLPAGMHNLCMGDLLGL